MSSFFFDYPNLIHIKIKALTHSGHTDISSATIKRNAELEVQLAELEVERSVWKNAHAVALENAERDAKAHNAQVASLNKQLSSLDLFRVSGRNVDLETWSLMVFVCVCVNRNKIPSFFALWTTCLR